MISCRDEGDESGLMKEKKGENLLSTETMFPNAVPKKETGVSLQKRNRKGGGEEGQTCTIHRNTTICQDAAKQKGKRGVHRFTEKDK